MCLISVSLIRLSTENALDDGTNGKAGEYCTVNVANCSGTSLTRESGERQRSFISKLDFVSSSQLFK